MKREGRRAQVDLRTEAKVLSPLISQWKKLYEHGEVDAASFAGAFVLAYLSVRHGRWTGGRLDASAYGGGAVQDVKSSPVRKFEGLEELLGDVSRWFKEEEQEELTVLDILSTLKLDGIKKNKDNLANRSLVCWLLAARPFVLMFRIPSPIEVLKMQARGERVVTMLTSEEELSSKHTAPLRYMEGEKLHSRDALEFLVHDLAHMEKFVDKEVYEEQWDSSGACWSWTRRGLAEVEYCISDMNCCCTHLLKYLKAKLFLARDRSSSFLFHACWAELLRSFGVERGSKEEEAMEGVGFRAMREDESDCIRKHFRSRAGLNK
ncbi:hypothetical protein GUITHDRAFT_108701 [Guillardia theta CCMP2712]|uniref:Uncharacterized protein n=1 Tax=Guillardia theta (strain CCMP2712) TaxID=905079 RepID=L1JA67_GUITC|nr:hypothetical protein GUITHDRAFT_108701 [Guillardia theta CCMP2712]EKX45433.1 hypothetical protein GUITHDRAFT_108701 [Guillardia theta CCMP2712]|eukprot:XP_005832413.1 hypothetical protein GUITHDRAFT_108701 [Guillardia theta CCMP2712]